jgi:lipopolysaccharide biosynthesis regulator YciM
MAAALVLLLVGLGAMAAGVLIGRYYVPDDRQLRRTARHSRAYMRALSHLLARDHETVVNELRAVVEENVEDVEPYFALGAVFRSRGEHERAIRVHQALAVRERERRKLRQRAMYELGLDFRAAGMPRRATRAMEEVLLEEPDHEGALRALAALYEEQARFNEAAELWQRLGRRRGESTSHREHHLLVAAAQAALGRDDLDSARQLLKTAQKLEESAHFFAAAAELAAARNDHRGAMERLKQALIADPGLAPHLLPGLVAAEEGLATAEVGERRKARDEFDDIDVDTPQPAGLPAGTPLALPSTTAGSAASSDGATVTAVPAIVARRRTDPALPAVSSGGASASSTMGPDAPSASSATDSQPPEAAPTRAAIPAGDASSDPGAGPTPGSVDGPERVAARSVAAASPSTATPSHEMDILAPAAALEVSAPAQMLEARAPTPTPVPAPTPVLEARAPRRDPTRELMTIAIPVGLAPGGEAKGTPSPSGPRLPWVTVSGIEAKDTPSSSIAERVIAVLVEVEAQTGPRLELALVRAQLMPATAAARAELARELMARFPDALAARVASARLALADDDPRAIRSALEALASDGGAIAWALSGRWQCSHCGHRPGPFSWRCGQCRRWNTLRMETGVEPPPVAPRERRAAPRAVRAEGLLGTSPAEALPMATLDPGLSDAELASGGARRSLLGRVGGWVSGLWRRDAS